MIYQYRTLCIFSYIKLNTILKNFLLFDIISDVRKVTKVKHAINVNHIQDAFMVHAKNHGNVIATKDGVVYFVIKI